MKIKNILRTFIALWYLFGWLLHAYLGLKSPETYRAFGDTALLPAFSTFWQDFVMPNITILALLLAAFEIFVGLLLINKGRWVKLGLFLSICFNLFLVQMGLSYPSTDFSSDFLANRLPNLLFVFVQIPLFWGYYGRSIPNILGSVVVRL